MGSDPKFRAGYHPEYKVSIHAPAWGATGLTKDMSICETVSIHAPAWGATTGPGWWGNALDVSIHAPAWGATGSVGLDCSFTDGFNPRSRMGSDRQIR